MTVVRRPATVVVDGDGVVVTNAHVVGDAAEVEGTLADASRVRGAVVAADRLTAPRRPTGPARTSSSSTRSTR